MVKKMFTEQRSVFSTIPCANHETTDELSIVIHEYLYHSMEFIETMDGECKRCSKGYT